MYNFNKKLFSLLVLLFFIVLFNSTNSGFASLLSVESDDSSITESSQQEDDEDKETEDQDEDKEEDGRVPHSFDSDRELREDDDKDRDRDEEEGHKNRIEHMADVSKKVERTRLLIIKAEFVINEKGLEGKDITRAEERLEKAKELLSIATQALADGEYKKAEDFASKAKHAAMYSKGKDIVSHSEASKIGRDFGECVSDATKNKENLDECFSEFKLKTDKHVEDQLSDSEKEENDQVEAFLKELADELDHRELSKLLDRFTHYNFTSIDADQLMTDVKEVMSADISNDDKFKKLQHYFYDLKNKSSREKFEKKLLPFKDTDDDEWFYNFVDQMKEDNCISGYKDKEGKDLGEFKPANKIILAEAAKIVVKCLIDEEPQTATTDEFWANRYVRFLIDDFSDVISEPLLSKLTEGIEDTTVLTSNVTRAELSQLIADVLSLELVEPDTATFSDVPVDHPNAAAIKALLEKGVISGDELENTFRPDDVPSRAEITKIIILAKQLL